jgi:hypothetical protein
LRRRWAQCCCKVMLLGAASSSCGINSSPEAVCDVCTVGYQLVWRDTRCRCSASWLAKLILLWAALPGVATGIGPAGAGLELVWVTGTCGSFMRTGIVTHVYLSAAPPPR